MEEWFELEVVPTRRSRNEVRKTLRSDAVRETEAPRNGDKIAFAKVGDPKVLLKPVNPRTESSRGLRYAEPCHRHELVDRLALRIITASVLRDGD